MGDDVDRADIASNDTEALAAFPKGLDDFLHSSPYDLSLRRLADKLVDSLC